MVQQEVLIVLVGGTIFVAVGVIVILLLTMFEPYKSRLNDLLLVVGYLFHRLFH